MAMADADEEFDLALGYVDEKGRAPEAPREEPADEEERGRAEQVAMGLAAADTA